MHYLFEGWFQECHDLNCCIDVTYHAASALFFT
jgi:hypothetical protein